MVACSPSIPEVDAERCSGLWNLSAALLCNAETGAYARVEQTFAWGPDLSATEQGAGGIGGLAIYLDDGWDADHGSSALGPMFPVYDGNGNVVRLYDASADGGGGGGGAGSTARPAIMAEYRYGPFGEDRGRVGPIEASRFPFRWSTKYTDNETGLSYYGYRYYSGSLGRWISRDPIQEQGSTNLLAFVRNTPVRAIDALGLSTILIGPEAALVSVVLFPTPGEIRGALLDLWHGYYQNTGRMPDSLTQSMWQIGLDQFAASANPSPPPDNIFFSVAPYLFWPTTTKEHRGWIALRPRIMCDCDKKVVGVSTHSADGHPGYTPLPPNHAAYETAEQHPSYWPTNTSSTIDAEGACATVVQMAASRINLPGQLISEFMIGGTPPWIWRKIEYKICCDRSLTVKYSASNMPSNYAYWNGIVRGSRRQSGLGTFMLSGSVLAPGGEFATVSKPVGHSVPMD